MKTENVDLLGSAKIFLIQSLDEYTQSSQDLSRHKLTFSILHAMIAVELMLKERLSREGEALIYRKNKDGIPIRNKTLKMHEVCEDLSGYGVNFDKFQKQLLATMSGWRNYIVHYVPAHDAKARVELERLYNFIYSFLVNHLNEDFRSFLPKDYYQKMEKVIGELQNAIKAAKDKASRHNLQDEQNYCPSCYMVGVVENQDGDAYCHLCELELSWAVCPSCEEERHVYAATDNIFGDMLQCKECDERAEQMHIDYLIDKSRGK